MVTKPNPRKNTDIAESCHTNGPTQGAEMMKTAALILVLVYAA
jgi:hypothetical protein